MISIHKFLSGASANDLVNDYNDGNKNSSFCSNSDNVDDDQTLAELFQKFCSSSTIHGTYFWSESRSLLARLIWGIIVLTGVGLATFIINSSFEGWKQNPVITSVMQKSIEEISFPAITICPLEDTRFGHIERRLNEHPPPDFDTRGLVMKILKLIRNKRLDPDLQDCLMKFCRNFENPDKVEDEKTCSSQCPAVLEFEDFLHKANGSLAQRGYENFINDILEEQFAGDSHERARNKRSTDCDMELKGNCSVFVKDFNFLRDIKQLMPKNEIENLFDSSKLGTLASIYSSLLESDPEAQKALYGAIARQDDYLRNLNPCLNKDQNLPDLAIHLAHVGAKFYHGGNTSNYTNCNFENASFKTNLLTFMTDSLHPPHVQSKYGKLAPNPTFPICIYDNNGHEGQKAASYPDYFCNSFQTAFNDHGLCYTYNNVKIGLEDPADDDGEPLKIRKVSGCGKEKGLQLILDNHRLPRLLTNSNKNRNIGFKIFITVPGVITSKIPFTVDPSFDGEHTFYLHGIHHIRTTKAFRDWNKDAKICKFPINANLTHFTYYSQDNCLLECRLKKLSAKCGCTPWYLIKQSKSKICGSRGNYCIHSNLATYRDDLTDRKECDCINDCEMVHFFATLNKESYALHKEIPSEKWIDVEKRTGHLANYLLDPDNVFVDKLTKGVLMLANNMTDYKQFAEKRFRENIAVLNFFFDTAIITQINLELKTNIFDMISAIGGTLGLFTGISVITFAELFYWIIRFLLVALRTKLNKVNYFGDTNTINDYTSTFQHKYTNNSRREVGGGCQMSTIF